MAAEAYKRHLTTKDLRLGNGEGRVPRPVLPQAGDLYASHIRPC
jgi:hypothetical protein